MKLTYLSFDSNKQTDTLFDQQKGKTLEEYRQELLIKMAKRQFEKLNQLGIAVPVSLG